ncbi:MAG TPA: hypothetical protein VGF55_09520, partial [Gemmataceae bacterium]
LDGRPQAPGLELLVGRPGPQSLAVGWSARGVPEPGGLRFDLRVPACPVAVLELDLPADREPAVPREDGLLTGPLPGGPPDRRLWRLAFANATQVDLIVRPAAGAGPPPLVLARQRTRQDVTPGQTACEFAFDLEAPHGGVRDLTLECDPRLRPTEVTVRNLERWEVRPGDSEDEPMRVLVRLREPLQAGSLTLRGVAPADPGRPWTSPAAAVAGAVPRGESLTVRVHPDLRPDDWRAGSFRLVESAVAPDRWQVLTLQAGLIRAGAGRPTATLRPAGPDYQVRERLWWQIDADRMTLTAQLTFDVARGPVYQVPLRLPAGWDVDRVETDPPDLFAATSPDAAAPRAAGRLLAVDLQRALTAGAAARLTVQLTRRTAPPGNSAAAVPFPDVLPTAARGREGTLAVRVAPALHSAVVDAAVPEQKPTDSGSAPWDDAAADYAFPLRAAAAEGSLRLWRRPARLAARATTAVTVTGPQAAVACRVRLEPEGGAVESVLLHVTGAAAPWDWQAALGANRVRSVQRVDVPPPALLA